MLDICKCKGQVGDIVCPYKEKCYRYTSKPDEYQNKF